MKYLYGDSWEKYPIEENTVWKEKKGSIVCVNDVFNGMPEYMQQADMIYSDPPWNTGNLTCFFTKAEKENIHNFNEFADKIFSFIEKMKDKTCYLEIGKQGLSDYLNRMNKIFPVVQFWEITYYKKNQCYLVRGGLKETKTDFTGYDDIDTPTIAVQTEHVFSVCDFCMGRGLTAVAAYENNMKFYGTELNKRRLAVTIEKIAKLGGEWTYEKR